MGDKHSTLTIAEDIQQTADMILAEFSRFPEPILESVIAGIVDLPHKVGFYLKLLATIHGKDATIVERVFEQLVVVLVQVAATGRPWRIFSQSLLALCMAAATGLLASESLVALMGSVLGLTDALPGTSTRVDFLLWAMLLASCYLPRGGAFAELQARIAAAYSGRKEAGGTMAPDLVSLWEIYQSQDPVQEQCVTSPVSIPITGELLFEVDPSWDPDYVALQVFDDAFTCDPLGKYLIAWRCRHILEALSFNHHKCAEVLLASIPESMGVPEKVVAQFLFGEILRPSPARGRKVMFEMLLMDCCRQMRTFAPVLARTLNAVFERLDEFNVVAIDRLASWFAHHLTNFDYKWNWSNWSFCLEKNQTCMQLVFIRLTFDKLARLSFHERMESALPKEFAALIPPEPRPAFRYSSGEAGVTEDELEMAGRVSDLLHQRAPHEEILAALGGATIEGDLDNMQKEILLQCLLNVGSKSMSHSLAIIERNLPLFQQLIPKTLAANAAGKLTSNIFILDQISQFWRASPQHFEFVVERLVNYRILMPKAVLQWIFERSDEQLSDMEASFTEILVRTLNISSILRILEQSHDMPRIAAQKMARDASSERIKSVIDNLQLEFEQALILTLEKLATLHSQLVNSEEITAATEKVCADMLAELVKAYWSDCERCAKVALQNAGRRASTRAQQLLSI